MHEPFTPQHLESAPAGASPWLWTTNSCAVPLSALPQVGAAEFSAHCKTACESGSRIAALCALPAAEGKPSEDYFLLAVMADDAAGRIGLLQMATKRDGSYPALSIELPQAQAFERELYELYGIRPAGHPWLKPLRQHPELDAHSGRGTASRPAHPFFKVEGPSVHEVAVGPVHAGIIEPGHFRFQCHGETVLSLEIQLGYQHRSAESLLLAGTPARRLVVAESIAGDTAVGHALAYCGIVEALAGIEAPAAAQRLRAIALELERLSNHVGDLGALCNDVGYLPGASWFGRLRGEFLNLLMEISGNRFGRSLVRPGGVRYGIPAEQRTAFVKRLELAGHALKETADQMFGTPSIAGRFDHTGVVPKEQAERLGLVGPVARASGLSRDVRRDHPSGFYRQVRIPVATASSGDVMGRALVRWLETLNSLAFLSAELAKLDAGPLAIEVPGAQPSSLAVALVEGWRGEIVHLAATDRDRRLSAYKVVDPSFHNWFGLAMALRGNQISDFPLCNKSFNLSYAGHDL